MKRLLVFLAVALPLTASAATNSISGKVRTLYPKCIGCPPAVSIIDGETSTRVRGDLALDVAAYDGKTVTLTGESGTHNGFPTFEANGFAPGNSADFLTGTLEVVTFRCPPGARCIALARAPKVFLNTADGRRIEVSSPDAIEMGLPSLDGAKVTLRGTVKQNRCAPGVRCIGSEPTFYPDGDKNFFVKAHLEKFKHGRNGQTHRATLENGETILVSGSTLGDKTTVWMSGKMGRELISGAPMFRATSGSGRVPVVAAVNPFRPVSPDGSNVGRNALTRGGAAATGSRSGAAAAEGAGILRD